MSAADFDIIDELERRAQADPARLQLLTPEQRVAAAIEIQAEKNTRYKRDPWRWVCEQARTIDEASQEKRAWPADADYLHDYFDVLGHYNFIAVPKSRRMMVTWATAAWMCHKARFFPNWAGFVVSEQESKSAFVIHERIKYLEDHVEPAAYRRSYSSIKTSEGQVGFMKYDLTGSYIKALAQGADVLRAYTPSFVFLDESEFQSKAHETVVAATSFLEKNCKIVLVSSSNGPVGPIASLAKTISYTRFER